MKKKNNGSKHNTTQRICSVAFYNRYVVCLQSKENTFEMQSKTQNFKRQNWNQINEFENSIKMDSSHQWIDFEIEWIENAEPGWESNRYNVRKDHDF